MNQIRLQKVMSPHDPFAQELENLYLSAFPACERKGIENIYHHANYGSSDVFAVANKDGQFIGLVITLKGLATVLIEYLAIHSLARNKQYGSQVLEAIKTHYSIYTLCLEIEQVDEMSAPDNLKRRRKNFYERNGYYPLNKLVQYFDVTLELMATRLDFDIVDYYRAYQLNYGPSIQEKVYLLEDC